MGSTLLADVAIYELWRGTDRPKSGGVWAKLQNRVGLSFCYWTPFFFTFQPIKKAQLVRLVKFMISPSGSSPLASLKQLHVLLFNYIQPYANYYNKKSYLKRPMDHNNFIFGCNVRT